MQSFFKASLLSNPRLNTQQSFFFALFHSNQSLSDASNNEGRKPVISEGTANSHEQEDAKENDDEGGEVISEGTANSQEQEDAEENDDEEGKMISAITQEGTEEIDYEGVEAITE